MRCCWSSPSPAVPGLTGPAAWRHLCAAANILITRQNRVKIADWGLCASVEGGQMHTGRAGTHGYRSPEMLAGMQHGTAADMWSLG